MSTFAEIAERLVRLDKREFGSGATEGDIGHAEQLLGIRIIGGYREFLTRFGWAIIGGDGLYGLGVDVSPPLELVRITLSERVEMEPRLPHRLLPIMNDGAGNLYCIATDTANEPVVVFWDHEAGRKQVPETVASDFTSWLDQQLDDLA